VALVLVGLGRHSHPGVVGEQGDDGVDVAAFVGGGEAADELALALGAGRRSALQFASRHVFVERCPRALERGLHRCRGGVEHARHLGTAEAERVAEHDYRPLPWREMLQRGHEANPTVSRNS
jgi:hypothetical protein